MDTKPVLEIDGDRFDDLSGFYDAISGILSPGVYWGHNLSALDDVLRGGFGTPEGGFVLRWRQASRSRDRLGYPETIRYLEQKLTRCHPTNRALVRQDIEEARAGRGQTIFDVLVGILRDHGPGGGEAEDGVELVLEYDA